MADKQVQIRITAKDDASKEVEGIGGRLKGIAVGIGAAFAALGVGRFLGGFFKDSIKEALEAEKSMARLDAALRNVGLNYKLVSPEVERYLTNLQRTTRYSDDEGREAITRLVVATGSYGKALKDMQVVVDLAAFKQISLSQAADIVAKAHVGLGRELKVMGIEVKAGIDAVPQLTEKLKDHEKVSRTTADRLQMTNNLWKEFKEQIGLALIGSQQAAGGLTTLQQALVNLAKAAEENKGTITSLVDRLVQFGGILGKVSGFIIEHTPNWYSLGKAIGFIGDKEEETAKKTQQAGAATLASSFLNAQRSLEIAQRTTDRKTELTEEEIKAREKALEEARKREERAQEAFHKAVEAAEKESYKIRKDLMSEAQRAFLEGSKALWDKLADLQKAALAAGMGESEKYAEAVGHIQEAQKQLTREWADGELGAKRLATTQKDELSPSTQKLKVDLDELIGATVEGQVEDIKAEEKKRRLRQAVIDTSFALADGIDAVAGFARAAGLGSKDLDDFAGGIADIADGIGRIASGDIIGGITGAIGGIKSIASMFFGESESARRVRIALENTVGALERHRATLGDLIETQSSGGKVAGIQQGLTAFLATSPRGPHPLRPYELSDAQLSAALAPFGVSLGDVESLARDLGINLRPNGKLDLRVLREFAKAVGALDTGIPEDWASQLQQIQDVARTRGDTSQQILSAVLGLLAGPYGSQFLFKELATLSPAQMPAKLAEILANIGSLSPAQLGGLNLQQFRDVIQLLADLSRSVGGTTTGTTGTGTRTSLPDIPTPALPPMPSLPGLVLTPSPLGGFEFLPPTLPGPVGSSGPRSASQVTALIENVTVNVAPTEWNPQEIAKAVGVSVGEVLEIQATAIEQMLANNYQGAAQSRGDVTLL